MVYSKSRVFPTGVFKSLNRPGHTLKDCQKTMTGVDGDPVLTQTESHSGNL